MQTFNLSSIPYGSRPCMVCSVIGVEGRKFESVNLIPFSVFSVFPYAVFVTRASGPYSAEECWPHTFDLPCTGEGSPPHRAAGHRACNCCRQVRNA